MKLGMEVGLGPSHIVLDGDAAPVPPCKKRGTARNFWPHVHCGHTAGCIKIPLGTEIGLGPSDIVSHGDLAPLYTWLPYTEIQILIDILVA